MILPLFIAAPLTLASMVLSYINFAYTSWKLKTLDHRVQQLPMQTDSVFSTALWFSWFNCQWVSLLIKHFISLLIIHWFCQLCSFLEGCIFAKMVILNQDMLGVLLTGMILTMLFSMTFTVSSSDHRPFWRHWYGIYSRVPRKRVELAFLSIIYPIPKGVMENFLVGGNSTWIFRFSAHHNHAKSSYPYFSSPPCCP